MEWKNKNLSCELSLTCWDNGNYYKRVHHPIPTRENMEHPSNFFKKISKLCIQLSVQVYSVLGQTERCKKGSHFVRLPPKHLVIIRDEKVSLFVKYEIILPVLCLCFLLDSLINKHCRTWSSMINL